MFLSSSVWQASNNRSRVLLSNLLLGLAGGLGVGVGAGVGTGVEGGVELSSSSPPSSSSPSASSGGQFGQGPLTLVLEALLVFQKYS